MNLAEIYLLANDLDVLTGTLLSDFTVNQQYIGCSNQANSFIFPINVKAGYNFEPRLISIGRWGRHIVFRFSTCTFVFKIAYKTSINILKRSASDTEPVFDISDACVNMTFKSLATDYTLHLSFQDPLQCGLVAVYPTGEVPVEFSYLGMDIIDSSFNFDYLHSEILKELTSGKEQVVKSFIMDTNVIAWLDNEFASEALFIAGIHPHTKISDLSEEDIHILVSALQSVYAVAIEHIRNDCCDTFAISLEDLYSIYGKVNESCIGCSSKIKKSVIKGQATYWCPQCQKAKVKTR